METTLLLVTLFVLMGAGLIILARLRARDAANIAALFAARTRDHNSLSTLKANVERLLADKRDAERADRLAASGWARRQAEGLVRAVEGAASQPDRPRFECFGGLYFSLEDVLYVETRKLYDDPMIVFCFRNGHMESFQGEEAIPVIEAFRRRAGEPSDNQPE